MPDREGIPVDVALVRPEDMLVARLTAPGCRVDDTSAGPMLTADGPGATIVLHLPPQHVGERAWNVLATPGPVSAHRVAEPSRLVLELDEGVAVPFTLAGVLAAIPTLRLKVTAHATPVVPPRRRIPGLDPPWRELVLAGFGSQAETAAEESAGEPGTPPPEATAEPEGPASDLGPAVFGAGSDAGRASTRLRVDAVRVLQHGRAARVVRGTARGGSQGPELGALAGRRLPPAPVERVPEPGAELRPGAGRPPIVSPPLEEPALPPVAGPLPPVVGPVRPPVVPPVVPPIVGPIPPDRPPVVLPPIVVPPIVGPPIVVPPIFPPPDPAAPVPPADDETSIEAPYRLTVSPSVRGAFRHPVEPVRDVLGGRRAELWRTHLTVRVEDEGGAFLGHDDADEVQRAIRAVWTRDLGPLDATAATDPGSGSGARDLDPQSLLPDHRRAIVRQTSDTRLPKPPQAIPVKRLALSSLGAWIDWTGTWESAAIGQPPPHHAKITLYRHQAVMGRDTYVRVDQPGFLFPFGHKAVWVTVSERRVVDRNDAVAYLWQRTFIIVRQPTRTYGGHDSPFAQVTLEPLVTPNLDPVGALGPPFVPTRLGVPFPFTLVTTDRSGAVRTFSAPLVFVPEVALAPEAPPVKPLIDTAYFPVRNIAGLGQQVALARETTAGDTTVDVNRLNFDAEIDAAGFTSRPFLVEVNAVVPSMRHLAPHAPGVDLVYAPPFLGADADGFGGANPGQVFLALAGPAPAVDFTGGSDRSGGFLAPNLVVRALSRTLGAVGEDGTAPDSGLKNGTFNPQKFLEGALPKLFGLFSLVDLLDALGIGLDDAPEFVTEALDAVAAVVSEADRLRRIADEAGPRLAKEVAQAAHDGARAALQDVQAQVEAAVAPLITALDAVVAAIGDLPDAPDIVTAVTTVKDRLLEVVDAVDALLAVVQAPQVPAVVRAEIERPAKALQTLATATETLDALASFAEGLLSGEQSVTARFEWRPRIQSWPDDANPVFKVNDERGMRLAIEVRASASSAPSVDVAAELADFQLVLLPGAALMGLSFSRIGFRVTSGGKPEVDVVFGGIEFLGPLEFIETLRRMIPFDGFADPPFVDVSPEGVVAGFDVALPSVAVGVFALENISLGADARVPFLGDAVTVGFHFCSKDSPFRLTVMCIGGGGWVELRASPKGMVLLEMGLEACACLSIDLGVASGSVSIAVGVYLRLEADKGLLTAYFRIRGEVDVLGLISASITLELSLTYHFESGKLIGKASLVVEVEVLFFSASVEITVEKKLAGSRGDPTLRDVMPPEPDGTNADWSAYCEAFAPLPEPV